MVDDPQTNEATITVAENKRLRTILQPSDAASSRALISPTGAAIMRLDTISDISKMTTPYSMLTRN